MSNPFSRENGNGYLENKNVENFFLKALKQRAREICEKFKIENKIYPSKIYYRVNDKDQLTFLDLYSNGSDIIFKTKDGKLIPDFNSMDEEIRNSINSMNGGIYKKAFLNALVTAANQELVKALSSK